MAEGSTPASLVNRALQEIAAQATVTGAPPTFDGSTAGLAAGILYQPAIAMLLRQQRYEFARMDITLIAAPGVPYPWANCYVYPLDCARIWSVKPATWDQNDPQAVRWTPMEQVINGQFVRVIACNVPAALLTYSTMLVTEGDFDTVFEETLVRYLASELAMALGGRPDFSTKMLEQAGSLVGMGAGMDS